jgi:hypothetical protein
MIKNTEDSKGVLEFYAHIKQIKMRNLVSGDKEVVLDLRVVGKDIIYANELANLPIETEVKVVYEK